MQCCLATNSCVNSISVQNICFPLTLTAARHNKKLPASVMFFPPDVPFSPPPQEQFICHLNSLPRELSSLPSLPPGVASLCVQSAGTSSECSYFPELLAVCILLRTLEVAGFLFELIVRYGVFSRLCRARNRFFFVACPPGTLRGYGCPFFLLLLPCSLFPTSSSSTPQLSQTIFSLRTLSCESRAFWTKLVGRRSLWILVRLARIVISVKGSPSDLVSFSANA